MRSSSHKYPVVTDHEKLIATLSQKDGALRSAWDILNGVLKGPTQAEKKWVIPKNHIAYYLKKLKEEGVCIEMEVNARQPEELTSRRQEDVKVDPWDLYVQAYQWAGEEVSKGKLSSRKGASEVYLGFGINLSHTTCAKDGADEGAPPKKKGKTTFVPTDVESKLVDSCFVLRSLNFPTFKEELIADCNNLIQGPKLVSLFKHPEVRDSWYYNWLRRYHERLGTTAAKPLEVDRERWTTSKNVGKHYKILEQTFVDLGFAFKNPSYSSDEALGQSTKFHPWALGQIVSFNESRSQLDMTDEDKNTRTTIAKELSDKGQTHAVKAGGSATVVGGSLANGFAIPAHIIFAAESNLATWTESAPVSDILDVSKEAPRVFAATFACNTTGTIKHDEGAIPYVKWNILPLLQGCHTVSSSNPIVWICDGHGSHVTYEFLIICRETGVVSVLRPPYTTAALQGEESS